MENNDSINKAGIQNHERFMESALKLAANGLLHVAPNPMVGCVIVHQGKIVADGYHVYYGGPHAEVNAVNHLPASFSPAECTVYVTLEPCSHYGKTPPCANLLIEKGFKTVVVACTDPNPQVAGNGIRKLEAAGIQVISGILEQEARALNKRFFTFHQQQRPYVFLKWAQTADGFICRLPLPVRREENTISSPQAHKEAHALRASESAILVGKNTVLADNPRLTTRLTDGPNPLRCCIDQNLSIPKHYEMYSSEAPTVIYNALKEAQEGSTVYKQLDFSKPIVPQILHDLWERKQLSVIIEGGTRVLNQFIETGLWDEVLVYVNQALYFNTGVAAPDFIPLKQGLNTGAERHHFVNTTVKP